MHTPHIAAGQSIPDQPPSPAFRITASSFGNVAFRRLAQERTERREPRSTLSGMKWTRDWSVGEWDAERRCAVRRRVVSWALRVLRVVKIMWRDVGAGRVWRNSSASRQQIENPRPLQ